MKKKPRVIVCQNGARHRYAIPRILEERGFLKALYTNSSEYSTAGKVAKFLSRYLDGRWRSLANRRISGIPRHKVFSKDNFLNNYGKFCPKEIYLRQVNAVNRSAIGWGVSEADVLYCIDGENVNFVRYAREKNLKVVVDVILNPQTHKIMFGEAMKYPSLNSKWNRVTANYVEFREEYFKVYIELADVILCPSNWVAEGVRNLCKNSNDKIIICPYGSSINFDGSCNVRTKGRFFWAGGDWLRKGLHYLHEAAEKLLDIYPDMEFRIAGVDLRSVGFVSESSKKLTFLGKLNYEEMRNEFLNADCFVFPTISEGLVGTVIEAMNAGCPVITTKCSGVDIISNEYNGLIVREQDSEDLMHAIEKIYLESSLRDRIAVSGLNSANYYSLESWGDRLVAVLQEI